MLGNDVLRTVPLLSALSAAEIDLVAKSSRRLRYPKKSIVFQEGDLGDFLLVILHGRVKDAYGGLPNVPARSVALDKRNDRVVGNDELSVAGTITVLVLTAIRIADLRYRSPPTSQSQNPGPSHDNRRGHLAPARYCPA